MRLGVVATAICLSIVNLSAAQDASAAMRMPTNIPPQGLGPALQALAQSRDLQVLYFSGVVKDLRTGGASGELTTDEALTQLLSGTGLTYQYVDDKAITVLPIASVTGDRSREPGTPSKATRESARAAPSAQKKSFWSRLRFAQSNSPSPSEGAEQGEVMTDAAKSQQTLNKESIEEVTVVVTGTRLRTAGESSAPVTVLDREQIEELGVASLPDLLRYLPQQTYTFREGNNVGGAQFVELRGLGVDTSLVLINGRRAIPSGPSVAFNAFDLNTLPLSAVERIEVLSESASAVYGADAIGGVINIILKDNVERPEVDLHYGAARGGGEERRASVSLGASTKSARGSLVLDVFERDFLFGKERERWRDQDFRRFGSIDRRSANANPGTVSSRTSANLPGLPARVAAVPEGSTGVGLTPADFVATAGQRNFESLRRYWSIFPKADRRSALLNLEFDLTSHVTLDAEAIYVDRSSISQLSPSSLSGRLVPASNAFNPFGTDVTINYLLTGIEPLQTVDKAKLQRGGLALQGTHETWDWEVSVLASSENGRAWDENTLDATRVNASLASSDPAQALNVFQDGPGGSPALLASFIAPRVVNQFRSEGVQAGAHARGAIAQLPAGALEVVFGGEWREEDMRFDSPVSTTFVAEGRQVAAAFVEARAPLLSERTVARRLDLTVAGRLDDYNDFGSSFNPQYGIVWQPSAALTLRASYGSSFRAPSLFDLYSPQRLVPNTLVSDPRRNNETVPVTVISGGNPQLGPTEADSLSAGFIITPTTLPTLRVTGTYWKIEMQQRVAAFSPSLHLNFESQFPERIVRAAPTPADVAAGLPGALISIDGSRINFGRLETSGIDAAVEYSLSTRFGEWSAAAAGTWIDIFESVDLPGTPQIDRVGMAHDRGTITKWRAVATLGWRRAGLSAALTIRHTPSYADATIAGVRTGRDVPDQTLLDLQLGADFDAWMSNAGFWGRGWKVTAGLFNVFDEEPHFAEVGVNNGYDLSQGDLRQSAGYINVSKTF